MSNLTAIATTTQPQGTAPAIDEIVETPTWLPNGCPSWCEDGDLHRENDHQDDRTHCGAGLRVRATTEDRDEWGDPQEMAANLIQNYREAEARIWVGVGESNQGCHFTPDEAREYALRILELVRITDGI